MYEGFYHLKENPFRLTADPGFVCMTPQHQEALSGLIYSVCTRPGLTLLIGEAGTGKTTLLYSLLTLLEKRQFVPVICTNPTLTREEFFDFLVLKFDVDCLSTLKSRRLQALEDKLKRNRAAGRPSVLIIDEAQRLSPELLEEVRLLLNMETPQEKLLQIIMSGQPELSEIMRHPELRQLKQRVSCACKLRPLTLEEMRGYLEYRLAQAGLPKQTLFPEAVIHLICSYTQGIPRLVNSLCDSALQLGFAAQSPVITEALIKEAAIDLDLASGVMMAEPRVNGHSAGASASATVSEPAPAAVPVAVPAAASLEAAVPTNGKTAAGGHSTVVMEQRIPLAGYGTRPKGSLGLFSSFLDYWR